MPVADLAQRGDDRRQTSPAFAGEVASDASEVLGRGVLVLTRQRALAQRAVGDDEAALLLGPRQQVAFRIAMRQAEEDLVREDGQTERLLTLLPGEKRVIADSDMRDESIVDQAPPARHRGAGREQPAGP